ncbi:MAG: flagellar transcriptional regulator FlhD [Rubrivivax sp.]|nr:flagellar transcriptional regulator FlhD [Rubrivivax sp.]
MTKTHLSEVQIVNLTMLLTIRDEILRDRTAACCRFALDAAQAERLGTMSVQQLMAFVVNLGNATLFPPRRDLVNLLDTPLPLVPPLAAVHAPHHVTASSAA